MTQSLGIGLKFYHFVELRWDQLRPAFFCFTFYGTVGSPRPCEGLDYARKIAPLGVGPPMKVRESQISPEGEPKGIHTHL